MSNISQVDVIMTPFMSHKGVNLFLEALGNQVGCHVVHPNFLPKKIGLKTIFYILKNISIKDLKSLYFASVQRQLRRSSNGKSNNFMVTALFLRGLFQVAQIVEYSTNKRIIFFPTSEPYIESYVLRCAAYLLGKKPICYYARDFVALETDEVKYGPVSRSFGSLTRLWRECILNEGLYSPSINSIQMKAGGGLVGCEAISGDDVLQPNCFRDKYIIFLHDFYDSPGIFGEGIFDNLVDWFEFTLKVLIKNEIPFLIKEHPNQLEKSRILTTRLVGKYNLNSKLIGSVSSSTILKGNPKCVITNHGSIIIESVASGVPCAYSGRSIASVVGVCKNPVDRGWYRESLLNPKVVSSRAEASQEFISKMSSYEFDNKFQIPLIYSKDKYFMSFSPKTDRDLREICESNAKFYEVLKAALSSPDFVRLKEFLLNA